MGKVRTVFSWPGYLLDCQDKVFKLSLEQVQSNEENTISIKEFFFCHGTSILNMCIIISQVAACAQCVT